MVEKQLQEKSDIQASDIDFHTWSSIAQNVEDEELRARVTGWEFNSEIVKIHYRIPTIPNREFTQELDAKIYPDRKSEFERLLSRYGYEDYHRGVLKDEMIDLEVKREDDELQFHVKTYIEDVNSPSEKRDTPDFVKSDAETRFFGTALQAFVLSLIPILNIILFHDIVYRNTIDKLVHNQTEYAILTMFASVTFFSVYILIPILWYLIG